MTLPVTPIDIDKCLETKDDVMASLARVPDDPSYKGIKNVIIASWLLNKRSYNQTIDRWVEDGYPPVNANASMAIRRLFKYFGYHVHFEVRGTRYHKRCKSKKAWIQEPVADANNGFAFSTDLTQLTDQQLHWVSNHIHAHIKPIE